jgi:hypothetical protein
MKIKILTSCSGTGFSYGAGEIANVTDALGLDLVEAGHAEAIVDLGSEPEVADGEEKPTKMTTKRKGKR